MCQTVTSLHQWQYFFCDTFTSRAVFNMATAVKLLLRCPPMINGNLQVVRTYTHTSSGLSKNLRSLGALSCAIGIGGGVFYLYSSNIKVPETRSDVRPNITPYSRLRVKPNGNGLQAPNNANSGTRNTVPRFALGCVVHASGGKVNKVGVSWIDIVYCRTSHEICVDISSYYWWPT